MTQQKKKKGPLDEARARLYAALDKAVGPGQGRLLPDQVFEPLERVSTSMVSVDYVTGGGIPYGKLTEIFGAPAGGKTALAMRILGNIQRAGHPVALIDAEHAFDPYWASKMGLNPDEVFLLWPHTSEEAVKAILTYINHGVRGIVLDSIPAMRTAAEMKGKVEDAKIGEGPRLWAKALPRIIPALVEHNAAVILLNQVRANIGGHPSDPTHTAGGYALKHAYTLRLELTRIGGAIREKTDDEEKVELGFWSWLRVPKNRGPMGRRGRIPFLYGHGFSPEIELLELGTVHGVFKRSGSWYSYGDERMGQGRDAALNWLLAHPDLIAPLQQQLLSILETTHEEPKEDEDDGEYI